jgi:hypothetical protein
VGKGRGGGTKAGRIATTGAESRGLAGKFRRLGVLHGCGVNRFAAGIKGHRAARLPSVLALELTELCRPTSAACHRPSVGASAAAPAPLQLLLRLVAIPCCSSCSSTAPAPPGRHPLLQLLLAAIPCCSCWSPAPPSLPARYCVMLWVCSSSCSGSLICNVCV